MSGCCSMVCMSLKASVVQFKRRSLSSEVLFFFLSRKGSSFNAVFHLHLLCHSFTESDDYTTSETSKVLQLNSLNKHQLSTKESKSRLIQAHLNIQHGPPRTHKHTPVDQTVTQSVFLSFVRAVSGGSLH